MRKISVRILIIAAALLSVVPASARLNWGRILSGGIKTVTALTITDSQMAEYVHQTVVQMDRQNNVAPNGNKYDTRLKRLTANLKSAEGIPLNFKVYLVRDVNAFACPDGSVRVFSALMDIMDDDELLGVIGHEIGHVAKKHSKNAYKNALLTSAAIDAVASASSTVAAISDSQLGALGESLLNASFSRKQETEADNYGYDFLKRNECNPLAMAKAFKKLDKLEKQNANYGYLQKMFSSHPDTEKRIKNIETRAAKDGFRY